MAFVYYVLKFNSLPFYKQKIECRVLLLTFFATKKKVLTNHDLNPYVNLSENFQQNFGEFIAVIMLRYFIPVDNICKFS
mgnify:CR=1 FL=1